jgi:hypothetical protein
MPTGYELYGSFPWRRPVLCVRNDPPSSPTGKRCIVGIAPTGDFVGHANEIARHNGVEWLFDVPEVGWRTFNKCSLTHLYWTGTSWSNWPPSTGSATYDGGDATSTYGVILDGGNANG